MASTWSSLGIRLMTTGENDNTWGDQTNDNLKRFENATKGVVDVAVSGDTTLTFTTQPTSYSSENGRQQVLRFTGTPGATRTITLPNIQTNYNVLNDTNQSLTFSAGSGAAT